MNDSIGQSIIESVRRQYTMTQQISSIPSKLVCENVFEMSNNIFKVIIITFYFM